MVNISDHKDIRLKPRIELTPYKLNKMTSFEKISLRSQRQQKSAEVMVIDIEEDDADRKDNKDTNLNI